MLELSLPKWAEDVLMADAKAMQISLQEYLEKLAEKHAEKLMEIYNG